jgi:hypothetical protein
LIKKVAGDVTDGAFSITEKASTIAEKVLETGQASLKAIKSLASAVIEQDGEGDKEVSYAAEKVSEGDQATVEETKRLAAPVLYCGSTLYF